MKQNYAYKDNTGNLIGGIDPVLTGEFIPLSEAKTKYSKFQVENGRMNGTRWIEPFAFAYGLKNLKGYVKALENENRNSGNSDLLRIKGVRAYLVMTPYEDKPNKYHYDLMMIPVRGDGTDYRQIDKGVVVNDDSLFLKHLCSMSQ